MEAVPNAGLPYTDPVLQRNLCHPLCGFGKGLVRARAEVLEACPAGVGDPPVRSCGAGETGELRDRGHVDHAALPESVQGRANGRLGHPEIERDLLGRERTFGEQSKDPFLHARAGTPDDRSLNARIR